MSPGPIFSSLTRISDLENGRFDVDEIPIDRWSNGDYVVVEVTDRASGRTVELTSGRMIELTEGDRVVGALGRRHATLEATGTWEEVGEDGRMEILTGGGLLGRCTSRSMVLDPLPEVHYRGHVLRRGETVGMGDFVVVPDAERAFETPAILVIGTSMSAGKTTAARILVRRLKERSLRVLAAKLTGAGRYRDILTMGDAGADGILDFVDAGLPSTVVPEEEYRDALRILLSRMGAADCEIAVLEIGASPLEPYNGALAVEKVQHAVGMTVLCASDPYAVLGVMSAFGADPDLVSGIASNTRAGIELVEELAGVRALNIRDKASLPELDRILERCMGLEEAS